MRHVHIPLCLYSALTERKAARLARRAVAAEAKAKHKHKTKSNAGAQYVLAHHAS
jgi:hypothetical protein